MNKTKRIVSTLVLLTLLCALFAALPTAATAADENLLTNGKLADEDGDGIPDGWSRYSTGVFSLVTPTTEGYAPPSGWEGNYILANKAGNAGVRQSVRQLEPGALYKATALYSNDAVSPVWEFKVMYYSGPADANGTLFSDLIDSPVKLSYNNTAIGPTWSPSLSMQKRPFEADKGTSEYIFKMPEISSGTLPEGATLGLSVCVRTTNANPTFKVTNICLEKTKNYIADGSFEKGLGEWKITTGTKADDAVIPTVETAADAPEGKMVVKMADSKGQVYLSQKIFVEKEKTYHVRFWFKAPDGSVPRLCVIDGSTWYAHYENGGNVSGNNPSTTAWRQYTYYFTTSASSASVEIRLATCSTGGKTVYFDGIEVSEMKDAAETALYNPTDGSAVTALPVAGTELLSRTIVTTKEPNDTAFVFYALYKHNETAKQLVDVQMAGGTALAQITHFTAAVKTNFIEITDTYTMPTTLDTSAEYSLKVFVFEDLQNIKNLNKALTLQ